MKLLFDQNLSFKLAARLADIFAGSDQVRNCGLDQASDAVIWEHAKSAGSQSSRRAPTLRKWRRYMARRPK